MTNLIAFPGCRRAPPVPIVDDLTALEIELVRARISQINSEICQGNIFMFWYCLKRVVLWGLLFWLLATFVGAAQAQTQSRTYFDNQGRFAGSQTSRGNSSSFYGSDGSFAGSSVRHGTSTSFFDSQGRFTGTSIGTSPRR